MPHLRLFFPVYRLLSTAYLRASTVYLVSLMALAAAVAAEPMAEPWDYAPAMREVAKRFKGNPGVVLHVGDSMTYSNPYGQWARGGAGKTPDDRAVLEWMHTGADNHLDGWWLCRFDHPAGGRSYTAAGGLRLDELLAGGKQGLAAFVKLLEAYQPQAIVLMIGTNDASAGRKPDAFQAELQAATKLAIDRGVVVILSTIPPHPAKSDLAGQLNGAIREVARRGKLPLIDLEKEILARRPNDWNGTLLTQGDVHLSAVSGDVTSASAPTEENLREVGYLLRGWLSVRKLAEVKRRVFDNPGRDRPGAAKSTAVKPAAAKPAANKRAVAETLRLEVTRDTWLSEVGKEADGNTGGADRLKVKSIQEMSLVDFDPAPLRGRLVKSATLHLKPRGEEILRRMTVGSISADWVEGTAANYEPQPGSSCFNWRQYPDMPWAQPGSDVCEVIFSRGGSRWRTTDAAPPEEGGWQAVAVDPKVIAARVAECSYGLFVFDDTGSEWTREGDQFKLRLFPNRFLHSRESGQQNAPYLTIEQGERDNQPPRPPTGIQAETSGLPPGEAHISWLTPKDTGPGETIGFHATLDGEPLAGYLLPAAGQPGQRVTMHLRDVAARKTGELSIRAVDSAGNVGNAAKIQIKFSAEPHSLLPPRPPMPDKVAAELPKLAGAEVAVVDALDKAECLTGALLPTQPEGYLAANHLWDARSRQIHLHAAKNEFTSFQLLVKGNVPGIKLSASFTGHEKIFEIQSSRLHSIRSDKGEFPDAVVPLGDSPARSTKDHQPASRASEALLCEIYVPHDARSADFAGELLLSAPGADPLRLKLRLTVWDFTLPDYLSFLPEMNCYGLPANERAYYRLAHRHRTFINRVPYHQNGAVEQGCAPAWDGKRLDWQAWDKRFGPYFDGSAFADLPRRSVPIEGFYLPWHENWPLPMEGNFNGDYWADRAFTEDYRQALVAVARQMAQHFDQRGWHDTLFQGFLNNKNNFKEQGWFRGSSPWLLDEPANFQDYWALAWFGQAFHEGVDRAKGQAKLLYRCDISRPQWQRELFDDVLDYNVVGGAMRRYRRMVLDRKQATGQVVVEYGAANAIDQSNVQPAAWCVDAWSLGMDGVLPWQTIGNDQSWQQADTLALFYPGQPAGLKEPVVSLRLKAFCRGQQDVEYLTLYSQLKQAPRWQLGDEVRRWLRLAGERRASDLAAAEDAGVIHYKALKPQDLWALRTTLGQALSDAHPPAKRRLVEFQVPTRDIRPLSEYVVE